jgi:hypothetical protein
MTKHISGFRVLTVSMTIAILCLMFQHYIPNSVVSFTLCDHRKEGLGELHLEANDIRVTSPKPTAWKLFIQSNLNKVALPVLPRMTM